MVALARLTKGTQSRNSGSFQTERRVLEEQHNQLLQEKDQIILQARAEVNQLMKELVTTRQEADNQIADMRHELEQADTDRNHLGQYQGELERTRQALLQREAELTQAITELQDVKVNLATLERTHEVEITAKQAELERFIGSKQSELDRLVEAKESELTRAIEAKQSEFDRLLQEKEEGLRRERELLTNQVQAQLDEQRKMFAQTEQAMLEKLNSASDNPLREATQQFLKMANETFDRAAQRSEALAAPTAAFAVPTESFDDLLSPVKEALERLERQNQLMERRRDNTFDAIEKGIHQLTSEAAQLANALRKPATQGAWGEMTITTILENAGLISGENFFTQDSGTDNKKRTDVIIKLPQNRMLVIDSSAPLDAFWDGMNARDDETRAIRMKAHARMVREHVRELGSAYYWSSYDTLPDCIIMFLPTEGAYFAALEADPSLLQEAKDSGVYLANPMTVLNMAHIAAYVLADDRVRQNAQEIKQLGSELYERLRMFGEHFTNVGQNLKQSVDSYNKALSWIDRNVMPTARKMQLLGTSKGKVLSAPSHIDKSVRSFQTPDMRELPLELTYEDGVDEA